MNGSWSAVGYGFGMLFAALMSTFLLEQLLSKALRAWLLHVDPLVSRVDTTTMYQRSLFTPSSPEVRRIWAGLCGTSVLAAAAGMLHVLWLLPALATLLLTLKWELDTWECVAVSPWQVAWRRGWRRSIRRLPMVQVARVHLIERELERRHGWLSRHFGRPLGCCYLALELHNGRAVKLPRTGLVAGRAEVERAARFLRQRLRHAERERVAALREHRRAMRRARPMLADPRDLALQRELADLRRTQSRQVHRIGRWPSPRVELTPDTGPDALPTTSPGQLCGPVYPAERAHG